MILSRLETEISDLVCLKIERGAVARVVFYATEWQIWWSTVGVRTRMRWILSWSRDVEERLRFRDVGDMWARGLCINASSTG